MSIPKPIAYLLFSLPWLAVLIVVSWLACQRYPASGEFIADTTLDGKSPWIQPFLPAQRVTPPGPQTDGWSGQRLTADPVYFTAQTPGPYDSVDVELELHSIHQPLIEFGMVRDLAGKELDLKPLYSSQLETLTSFVPAQAGQAIGYVAPGMAATRLQDPNPVGLMTWGATSSMPLLSDPAGLDQETAVTLRGAHDFYLMPAGGELRMTFVLQAANRSLGSDLAAFRVFRGDQELSQDAFGVNGSREKRLGTKLEHEVHIPKAEPGVYHIAFIAKDDVFIRSIRTSSVHWVVGPRLVFGDEVGYSTSTRPALAWSSSRHIVAETFHTEGLQSIHFGSAQTQTRRTHETYRLDRNAQDFGIAQLYAPRGDLRFIGDGFFALRQEAFFEPKPHRLTDGTDLVGEQVQAVLTPYQKTQKLAGDWLRTRVHYQLDPTVDHLRFVLSAPGVAARAGAVDIRRIRVIYHRPAQSVSDWWQTLHRELANAWHRL